MARFTQSEQDQLVHARVHAVEQIAQREQATDVDANRLARRTHAARADTVRSLRSRLQHALTRALPALARARVRARVRRELGELSPEMLRDVGITRTEIRRVAKEKAELAVPPKGGVEATDTPYFKTKPHGAFDIARYA
ncbi:DUF1127 domain-containing protein [Rhodovibrio salinarum]|nr:DUF1127 domain-containing protein [Rhodovibrio salinarum]